ncbi:hypothetical protein DFH07DRAFT_848738 [Mycena maculata]|uniref:Uncharacterized protein n=1 Tax=Mycena maculata TaxID=230809 RepID=A0AAD7MRY7_9AGAR|nr:hypothetical protein DFH07DRAFT_848738 [Mycena maculata]
MRVMRRTPLTLRRYFLTWPGALQCSSFAPSPFILAASAQPIKTSGSSFRNPTLRTGFSGVRCSPLSCSNSSAALPIPESDSFFPDQSPGFTSWYFQQPNVSAPSSNLPMSRRRRRRPYRHPCAFGIRASHMIHRFSVQSAFLDFDLPTHRGFHGPESYRVFGLSG